MQNFHSIASKYETLKARLLEINDITAAAGLLYWDQATYMPPGGATARGRQIATLRQIAHQKFTDPALEELLEDLKSDEKNLAYDSDAASLIRVTRRKYQKAVQVPEKFMARECHNIIPLLTQFGQKREQKMIFERCNPI